MKTIYRASSKAKNKYQLSSLSNLIINDQGGNDQLVINLNSSSLKSGKLKVASVDAQHLCLTVGKSKTFILNAFTTGKIESFKLQDKTLSFHNLLKTSKKFRKFSAISIMDSEFADLRKIITVKTGITFKKNITLKSLTYALPVLTINKPVTITLSLNKVIPAKVNGAKSVVSGLSVKNNKCKVTLTAKDLTALATTWSGAADKTYKLRINGAQATLSLQLVGTKKGTGTKNSDLLLGTRGKDTLNGGSGHDFLSAGDGHDKLVGAQGNDTLYGGAGNDTLNGGSGQDLLVGGNGNDLYYVENLKDKVIEQAGTASGRDTINTAGIAIDLKKTHKNIEVVINTGHATSIQGTTAAETITAGAFGDTINGRGGLDLIILGAGQDQVYYTGLEEIKGISRDDTLIVGSTQASSSLNFATYAASCGQIVLAKTVAELDGTTFTNAIQVLGNALNNTLFGTSYNDTLLGDTGNDTLYGLAGADSLMGGVGDDLLDGGNDNDYLLGDPGNDTLLGGAGNDTLIGDDGNDWLDGGLGKNTLAGGTGIDILTFGAADQLDGGSNADLVFFGTLSHTQALAKMGGKAAKWSQAHNIEYALRGVSDFAALKACNVQFRELAPGVLDLTGWSLDINKSTDVGYTVYNQGNLWLDALNEIYHTPLPILEVANSVTVNEAALATNNAANRTGSAVINLTNTFDTLTLKFNGSESTVFDGQTLVNNEFATAYGTIKFTNLTDKQLTYTYTLKSSVHNSAATFDHVTLTATNAIGSRTFDINVAQIIDDKPVFLSKPEISLTAAATSALCNNIQIDYGVDGSAATGLSISSGTYGTASISAQGQITYTLNAQSQIARKKSALTDILILKAHDADGSSCEQEVQVNIAKINVAAPFFAGVERVFVSEAGLSSGSQSGGTATSQGAVSIANEVDEILLKVNDHTSTVFANNKLSTAELKTNYGRIRFTGFSQGQLHYVYTLTQPATQAGQVADQLTLVAINTSSRVEKQFTCATILDDQPVFTTTPTVTVASNAVSALCSNVNYSFGADGPAKQSALTTYAGSYGTFTQNSRGQLSYSLNSEGLLRRNLSDLTDSVSLSITDQDGSSCTQKIAVNIAKFVAQTPSPGSAKTCQVAEADLQKFNQANAVSYTSYLTLDNTCNAIGIYNSDQLNLFWQNNSLSSNEFQTNYGKVRFTAYNNGTLSYTYTLTQTAASLSYINDDIVLVTTNAAGYTSKQYTLAKIIDDRPSFAQPDDLTMTIEQQSVSGKVDVHYGADGVPNANALTARDGRYGTVAINANGNFTYTLNADGVATRKQGDLNDTITFVACDSDGSTTTQTVKINIAKRDIDPPYFGSVNGVQVKEEDLVNNKAQGSSYLELKNPLTTLCISSKGQEIVVWQNGSLNTAQIATEYGSIQFTSYANEKLSYTYTLKKCATSSSAVGENIAFTATNCVGTIRKELTLATILDASPSIKALEPLNLDPAVNSIAGQLQVAFGADGKALNNALSVSQGLYGTVTVNQAGVFSYILNAYGVAERKKNALTDQLTFTAKDADGSLATQSIQLAIAKVTLAAPAIANTKRVEVNEAALDAGTGSGTSSVSNYIDIKNEVDSLNIKINNKIIQIYQNQQLVTNALATEYGTLQFTSFEQGRLYYTYTLEKPTHNKNQTESFLLTAANVQTSTAKTIEFVTIIDDQPKFTTVPGINVSQTTNGTSGSNLQLAYGADGKDPNQALTINQGQYGTFETDGQWWMYTLNSEGLKARKEHALTDAVTLTLKDSDGSQVTKTLNVSIEHLIVQPPVFGPTHSITVAEAGLEHGSAMQSGTSSAEGSIVINNLVDHLSLTINNQEFTVWQNETLRTSPITTQYGTLKFTSFDNGSLNYTYTLTKSAHTNTGANTCSENITFIAKNEAGSLTKSFDLVKILDDAPLITGANTLTLNANASSALLDLSLTYGADGAAAFDSLVVTQGSYGSISQNAAGQLLYTLNKTGIAARKASAITDTLTLTLKDSDGSQVSKTVNVSVEHLIVQPPVFGPTNSLIVSEAGLEHGSTMQSGTSSAEGSIVINNLVDDLSLSINNQTITVWQNETLRTSPITTQYGTLKFTSFVNGSLNYTYTLNKAAHTTAGANTCSENITFIAKNEVGSQTKSFDLVKILDDAPIITGANTLTLNANASSALLDLSLTYGADGAAAFDSLVVAQGRYGSLSKNAAGKWVYTLNKQGSLARTSSTLTDTLTITLKDSDGSQATHNVQVEITSIQDYLKITGLPTALALPLNSQDLEALVNGTTKLNLNKLNVAFTDSDSLSLTLKCTSLSDAANFKMQFAGQNSALSFNTEHTQLTIKGTATEINDLLQQIDFVPTDAGLNYAKNLEQNETVDKFAALECTLQFTINDTTYEVSNKTDFILDSFKHSTFSINNNVAYVNSINNLTYADFKNNTYTNQQVIDAEKTAAEQNDDNLCWAGTDANMLEWTNWGRKELGLSNNTLDREDNIFRYYIDNTELDEGYVIDYGLQWFFNGNNIVIQDGWVPSSGGNVLNQSCSDYVHNQYLGASNSANNTYMQSMKSLEQALRNGCGVGLSIFNDDKLAHAITCWGITYDPSYDENDYRHYTGLFITDPDDSKTKAEQTDNLRYIPLTWKNDRYILNIYSNYSNVYCRTFTILDRNNGVAEKFYDFASLTSAETDKNILGNYLTHHTDLAHDPDQSVWITYEQPESQVIIFGAAKSLSHTEPEILAPTCKQSVASVSDLDLSQTKAADNWLNLGLTAAS
ncbi:MAG: VCBS domain-containing protein [Desulfovibrionaceae bacterium]|nr:VCBS domain-containing protein [Desulfovibrionaceae bacterium]